MDVLPTALKYNPQENNIFEIGSGKLVRETGIMQEGSMTAISALKMQHNKFGNKTKSNS